MGMNFHGLGGILEKLPGGKEVVQVLNIVDPIVKLALLPVDIATSMATGMANMGNSLMKSGTKIVDSLAATISSPMFTYLVIGGLAIGGIMVLQNGGKAPLPPQVARMLGK